MAVIRTGTENFCYFSTDGVTLDRAFTLAEMLSHEAENLYVPFEEPKERYDWAKQASRVDRLAALAASLLLIMQQAKEESDEAI